MRTRIHTRRARKNLHRAQITHTNHVKLAVRQLRVRSNLHPAAKIARVRDTEIRNDEVAFVRIVELDYKSHRFVAHGCFQERRRKGSPVRLYSLDDFRAHAARSDAHKVSHRVVSVVSDV